jgi:hypothetical protein
MKYAAALLTVIGLLSSANGTAQSTLQPQAQPLPLPIRYGQGLGRLLTTEAERAKMDDLRFNIAPPPKPKEETGPPQLQIDGISNRPDRPQGQRITIWLDGRAYLEQELPAGLKLVRSASGDITGLSSQIRKGKTEFAKIGDLITRPQTADEAKDEAQAKMQARKETQR